MLKENIDAENEQKVCAKKELIYSLCVDIMKEKKLVFDEKCDVVK